MTICNEHIKKLSKNYEQNEKLYLKNNKNSKKLFNLLIKFIKFNKLILYGGTAINIYLPDNKKIYNDIDIPDYDLYTNNAIKTGKKLINLISQHNFKYVQMRQSLFNIKTFKIFVENIPLCDITEVSNIDYNIYLSTSNKIQNLNILNQHLLIYNMLIELSQPNLSYYRWEKVYNRYTIFNKIYGFNNLNNIHKINNKIDKKIDNKYLHILNDLLIIIKNNKYPLMNFNAINLLYDKNLINFYHYSIPYITTFSLNPKFIIDYCSKIININIIQNEDNIFIYLDDIFLIDIINANNTCISICSYKQYTIGTLFSIKYYLYKYLIYANSDNKNIFQYFIYLNNKLIKKSKCNNNCLMNTECYGNINSTPWQIRKQKWNIPPIKFKPKKTNNNIKTPINNI